MPSSIEYLASQQNNYTTTEKELISILECLKQSRGILFGYEVNIFSNHKNLVYDATLSESQTVMRWGLIIDEFGPNIHYISGVDNKVGEMLSISLSTPSNKYDPCISKSQCCANKLFTLSRVENNKYCFPLNILFV